MIVVAIYRLPTMQFAASKDNFINVVVVPTGIIIINNKIESEKEQIFKNFKLWKLWKLCVCVFCYRYSYYLHFLD